MPKVYLVGAYISTLKIEIKGPMRMFNPKTIHDARRFTRMQEMVVEKHLASSSSGGSANFTTKELVVPSVNKSKPLANYHSALTTNGFSVKPTLVSWKTTSSAQSKRRTSQLYQALTPELETKHN